MPIRRTQTSTEHRHWMERAVEMAGLSETEAGKDEASPKVGAVAIGPDGELLAEAHRGQFNPGEHAEYGVIKQLQPGDLTGATLFTTLEPCTERGAPKVPCASRLIKEDVAVVYIGTLDPDPRVQELGWKALRDAGVELRDFDSDLRQQLRGINRPFIERFQVATGPRGTKSFDYMQNDGKLRIEHNDIIFETEWSMAGHGSIHAYGPLGSIALARNAAAFDEIDDPGLYEFEGHAKTARIGQILIFKGIAGYALVRVEEVLAGPERSDPFTRATVTYELRIDD